MSNLKSLIANLATAAAQQASNRKAILEAFAKSKEVRYAEFTSQQQGIALVEAELRTAKEEFKKELDEQLSKDLTEVNELLSKNGFTPIQSMTEVVGQGFERAENVVLGTVGLAAGKATAVVQSKFDKMKAAFHVACPKKS